MLIGALTDRPSRTRADLRRLERAMVEDWPVSDASRAQAIAELDALIADSQTPAKVKVMAIRCLIAAHESNRRQQRSEQPRPEQHVTVEVSLAPADRQARIDALLAAARARTGLPGE